MKKIKILPYILLSFLTVMFTVSCDRNLPFEDYRDGGALVDISRMANTDGYVETDPTNVNIGVSLMIPEAGAGPFQSVQLVCVFNNTRQVVIQDNITNLPVDLSLNFAGIVSQLGLSTVNPNDDFTFTVNVVSPDGFIAYGWNETTKQYNNSNFTSWPITIPGGRAYSNRVSYVAQCPFVAADFQGAFNVTVGGLLGGTDPGATVTPIATYPDASLIPEGTTTADLYGMEITFDPAFWGSVFDYPIQVWINRTDYSLIMETPVLLSDDFLGGGYLNARMNSVKEAKANTCTTSFTFTGPVTMSLGTWTTSLIVTFSK